MKNLLLALALCFTIPALAAGPAAKTGPTDAEVAQELRRMLHKQLIDDCRATRRSGVLGRVEEGDLDADGMPTIYMPAPDQFDAWLTGWREYTTRHKIPANFQRVRCAWDTDPASGRLETVRAAIYSGKGPRACQRIADSAPVCLFIQRGQLCRADGDSKPTCHPL